MSSASDTSANRTPPAACVNEIKRFIFQAGYRKLRFLPNTPRATIFNTTRGLGYGITNPEALYGTAKVDNLVCSLNSPVSTCSFTTRDTVAEIRAKYGWDPLNPSDKLPASVGFNEKFPGYILEAGKALRHTGAKIRLNFLSQRLGDMHPMNFLSVPKTYRKKWYNELKMRGVASMKDLFPGWFVTEDGQERDRGNSALSRLFVENDTASTNRNTLQELMACAECQIEWEWAGKRDLSRYCAVSIRRDATTALQERQFSIMDKDDYSPLHPFWRIMYGNATGLTGKSATDGSFKDGTAGLGVFAINKRISSGIPGKQSIDRAEAFGVLADVLTSGGWGHKEILIDSQSTIQSIDALVGGWGLSDPRVRKKMANYSIIKSISDWITENAVHGFPTILTKVKSHTGCTDENSLMNEGADTEAEVGRMNAGDLNYMLVLNECYHNLPEAWLVIGTEVVERKVHSVMLKALDEFHISKAIMEAGPRQHLKFWEMNMCWRETAPTPKEAKASPHRLFRARTFSQSLPSPRNIQVSNMKRFPKLYPGSECPLCRSGVANDHHIFCKCGAVAQIRNNTIIQVKASMDSVLHDAKLGASIPFGLLKRCFTPSDSEEFLHGHVSDRMQVWAESFFSRDEREKWVRKVLPIFTKGYRDIWNKYTDVMADKKVNFAQRLKQEYRLTPGKLKNERR